MPIHEIGRSTVSEEEREIQFNLYELFKEERFENAKSVCLNAIEKYPDQQSFYKLLVTAYLELNDLEEAKKVIGHLKKKFGASHETEFLQSRIHEIEGNTEEEIRSITKAIDLVPEDHFDIKSDYLANYGACLIEFDSDKAREVLEQAVYTNPLNIFAKELLDELDELEEDEDLYEDDELDELDEDDELDVDDDEIQLNELEAEHLQLFTDVQKMMYFIREEKDDFHSEEEELDFKTSARNEWTKLFFDDPKKILDAAPDQLIKIYSSVEVNLMDIYDNEEHSDGIAQKFYESMQSQIGEAFPFIPKDGITFIMYAYPVLELEHIDLTMLAKFSSGDLEAGEKDKELIRLAYDAGKIIAKINDAEDEENFRMLADKLFVLLEANLGERKAGYLVNIFLGNIDESDS